MRKKNTNHDSHYFVVFYFIPSPQNRTHLSEELRTLLPGRPFPAVDQAPGGGRGLVCLAGPGHVGAEPVHADGGGLPDPRACPLQFSSMQLGIERRLEQEIYLA